MKINKNNTENIENEEVGSLYSIEEDEPLYNLEDDELDEEEPESEEEEPEKQKQRKASPIAVMFKTMIGPVEGWKALKRARFKTEDFAAGCFYPLSALAALSTAAMFFYEHVTVTDWVEKGLATFVAFFFGYFSALAVGPLVMPRALRDLFKKDIGKQFIMLGMSTLTLFWTLIQLLPMLDSILYFLPLWTIYLIVKGVRILRVPNDVKNSTAGLLCTIIIGLPILWYWIMSELLLPMTL